MKVSSFIMSRADGNKNVRVEMSTIWYKAGPRSENESRKGTKICAKEDLVCRGKRCVLSLQVNRHSGKIRHVIEYPVIE